MEIEEETAIELEEIAETSIKRYRVDLEYDGSEFFGWQFQPELRTVQGDIEAVLQHLYGQPVRVYGAGRTDTGVHALGQVAHFDAVSKYPLQVLIKALNYFLPEDIRAKKVTLTPSNFHARFSARWRWYQYRIFLNPRAVERKYGWKLRYPFAPELLKQAAELLNGEHDFTSFSGIDPETDNYRCYIHLTCWEQLDDEWKFHIVANRFLRHMVRRLVGSMLDLARGRYSIDYFADLMSNPVTGPNLFTAPAMGLSLMKVGYGNFPCLEPNAENCQCFPFINP
ncbi:MAG: tRNA pseudouridine(38-40) synthase TruA [bacterium]|nr:tRNA pseudouridine(38-40) synthase TruA [bacterium]